MIGSFEKPMNYPQYLKHLVPSVLTMIFLSFYTTIDGFFVSRYVGSDALAGINIVVPVTCVIFGVAVMIATGAGALIGERMGERRVEEANRIFSFMCCALVVFSIAFTVLGLVFLTPIVRFLGTSERLMQHVVPYAMVVFGGTLPMVFKLFFEYLVRTDGNSNVGLMMSVTGLVLNIVMDYLLVGAAGLGTLGAALGTCISITASALIGFVYFLKFSRLKFSRPHFDWKILVKSCVNGSSEMLTEFSTGITTFVFNIMILKYYGEDGVAAVTIIMYIYYFFISFYMGVAVATAPVISYNAGAKNGGKIRETLKHSFFTIGVTSLVIVAISLFGGPSIIGFFVDSGNVFEITWAGLKLFTPVFLFIGINVFLSGYFTALGDGLISAVISSLRSLIFVIILIILLPQAIGVSGIWLTMPLAEAFTIFVALPLYKRRGRAAIRCIEAVNAG